GQRVTVNKVIALSVWSRHTTPRFGAGAVTALHQLSGLSVFPRPGEPFDEELARGFGRLLVMRLAGKRCRATQDGQGRKRLHVPVAIPRRFGPGIHDELAEAVRSAG